jgi:hypothetical protein
MFLIKNLYVFITKTTRCSDSSILVNNQWYFNQLLYCWYPSQHKYYDRTWFKAICIPSKLSHAVMLLTWIWEGPFRILSRTPTTLTEVFCGFSKSIQAHIWTETWIRSRLLPSTLFQIRYSLSYNHSTTSLKVRQINKIYKQTDLRKKKLQ